MCKNIIYQRASIDEIEILTDYRVRFLNELYNHTEDKETQTLRLSLKEYFFKAITAGNIVVLLAKYNDEVIGIGGLLIEHIPPDYKNISGKVGYIFNMYTIKEMRNKGICSKLLNKLIDEAKRENIKHFRLHPTEKALNIYMRAGFTASDRIEMVLNF